MEEELSKLQEKIDEKKAELKSLTDLVGLYTKLRNFLYAYYEPVQDPIEAEFHFTTDEIYEQMMQVFHNEVMFPKEVLVSWLHTGGFTFYDFGKMKFEWLMKKV